MKLSDRLSMVASLVDVGCKVYDIGCDHAYLDIYLALNNENECIAIDKIKSALDNAKFNILKYKVKDKVTAILNDGIKGLDIKENDNIVISGMGGINAVDILKSNKLPNTLIISVNNNIEYLREEIVKMGYIIDTEIFIIDNKKPYVIIKFIKGNKKYKKIDYIVGPILKNNKDYKNYILKKYLKILKEVPKLKEKIKIYILILKIKFS